MAENFVQTESFNNKNGKVMIEHRLFGRQVFRCEPIMIINDDDRFGVHIQGCDIYAEKSDIVLYKLYDNMLIVADKTVTLTLIVNKL